MNDEPKVLSLDLGITTGWALTRAESATLIAYGHFPGKNLDTGIFELQVLWGEPRYRVAEPAVIIRGALGDELGEIMASAQALLGPNLQMISAFQWKAHPLAKTPCPRGANAHERDAIRLGLWYVKVRLQGQ